MSNIYQRSSGLNRSRSERWAPAANDPESRRISKRSSIEKVFGAMVMISLIATVLLERGCGLIPRKVTMDDPQVQRLVKFEGPNMYKTVDGTFHEAIF